MSARDQISDQHSSLLERIRIVLVEPQGPRNVGSVARAMQNFGLTQLHCVQGVSATHPEALEMGVKAKGILEKAPRHHSLEDALGDTTFVVGTTAKVRDRLPTLEPKQAAERILEEAAKGPVALMFGREDHGLDNEELKWAHATVAIPTSPHCRALNLSQAVLLLAWEIWSASGQAGRRATSDPGRLLGTDMRARLRADLLKALGDVGILHSGNHIPCEQSIDRILALAPMQSRDARLLFALARRVSDLSQDAQE